MAIRRLLVKSQFNPQEVKALCAAYDDIVLSLSLARAPETLRELFAERVVAVAKSGERDPDRIVNQVLSDMGIRKDFS